MFVKMQIRWPELCVLFVCRIMVCRILFADISTNTSYTFTMWDINEWSVLLVMLQFWPALRVIMGGCVYEFESGDLCHDQRVLWWGNSCGWQNKLENLTVARYCKIQQLENSEIKTIIMLMVQSSERSCYTVELSEVYLVKGEVVAKTFKIV